MIKNINVKKKLLFLVGVCLMYFPVILLGQNTVWEATFTKEDVSGKSISDLDSKTYNLDISMFEKGLEKTISRTSKSVNPKQMYFPNDKGDLIKFQLYTTQVLHPDLAKKFPTIKSYVGKSETGEVIHFSYSSVAGLHGYMLRGKGKTVIIKPDAYQLDKNKYSVFERSENSDDNSLFECLTKEDNIKTKSKSGKKTARNANDGYLRKYKLAVSTTGEYSQYFLDGSEANDVERKTKVLAAIVATMTRVNGVFERDFGVTMELVANTASVIYLNANIDPYDGSLNSELQNTLDTEIGSSNYDVGHVFGYENSIHGNAGCIACVCSEGEKGSAYSIHRAPETDSFNLLVMHEMGHQFGGFHVMNSPTCRSGSNSEVEPGSGSSIMSYAGICSPNVQNSSDDYFNYVDVRDVGIWTIENSDCAELIATANTAPTVNAGIDVVIPKSTPFVLEALANDANGLAGLTYCWEQNDTDYPPSNSTPQPNWNVGPLFRSQLPSTSSKRYFPQLSDVLSGNLTPTWEVLPSVGRNMDFAITVRDNNVSGGQTASDLMKVTVDGNSGPFSISSQNTNVTWESGGLVTVTWDVANTNVAPVNTTTVSILLSLDGGYTYETMLLENTPNDGEETFVLPVLVTSTTARIMVKADDNVFFAVNQSNFTTQASEFIMRFVDSSNEICQAETAVFTFSYKTFLAFDEEVTFSAESLPSGAVINFSPATISGIHNDEVTVGIAITGTGSIAAGDYPIEIIGASTSVTKRLTISLTVHENNIAIPTLSSPIDDESAIATTHNFTWSEDVNVSSYEIEIATDDLFVNKIETAIVTENQYTPTSLDVNSEYYYRVRGINSCGNGAFSAANKFFTQCSAPTGFSTVDYGIDYVTLEWVDPLSTSWEIEYGPVGFELGTGTSITVSSSPAVIPNLISSRAYSFYLRSLCSPGGRSNALGPILEKTTADYCAGDHFYDTGGIGGAYQNNENYTEIIKPAVAGERVRVVFNSIELENCCDYLRVYDGDSSSAPFLGRVSPSLRDFKSTHDSGALTFVFISDGSITYNGWDAEVFCEEKPNCSAPTDLTIDDLSYNTVDLSWVETDMATTWEIEYGANDFILGSGTIVNVSSNPFQLTELQEQTRYKIYIRAICNNTTKSDVSNPIYLTTTCAPIAAPFYESFYYTKPSCWEQGEGNDEDWVFSSYGNNVGNGGQIKGDTESGSYFAYVNNSYNHNVNTILETPSIDVSGLDNPGLTFYLLSDSQGAANVDFSVSVFNGANWVDDVFTSNTNTYEWKKVYVSFSSLNIVGPVKVRFKVDEVVDSNYDDIAIDDIFVGNLPNCIPSSFIKEETITSSSSITLFWDEIGNENSWTIEYGDKDFIPGTGTVVSITSREYQLKGLRSGTSYDFYLRGNCNGEYASLIGPYNIITEANYCAGDLFYDSGGKDKAYVNNENYIKVIRPNIYGIPVEVKFNYFETESGYDYLEVYDGLDVSAPFIGRYSGYNLPPDLKSTHPSGALTFKFRSDGSSTRSGWEASVSCANLPRDTFQISSVGESCKSSDNGSISIQTLETGMIFSGTLEGDNYSTVLDFSETVTFSNLKAGRYSLCITLAQSPDFKQCYVVEISEPEELSVIATSGKTSDKLVVKMAGSKKYIVVLNGKEITTHNDELELNLELGKNKLLIHTDKDCQGVYEETLFRFSEVTIYPNPIAEQNLTIRIPELTVKNVVVQVFKMNGSLVYTKDHKVKDGTVAVGLQFLPAAIYTLKVFDNRIVNSQFKIIKK